MNTLAIDIETYSSNDLKTGGVYKYVEAPDFEILLLAYTMDNGKGVSVNLLDLASEDEGVELDIVLDWLTDPTIRKVAHNSAFEICCLSKAFGLTLDPAQWSCTMAKAAQLGLPLSLDQLGKVLKVDAQKDAAGKALIKYFTMPCKPTKANGMRTRNLPHHDPEKWEAFKSYCIGDVNAERAVAEKISFFEVPAQETALWNLDQLINSTGVLLDPVLIENAIRIDIEHKARLTAEAIELTGLDNPNSVQQLIGWLEAETGEEVESLNKEKLPGLLENAETDTVRRVLQLRQEMSKTSVKKYAAMQKAVGADGRVRGLLQYYGAGRTGRWSGRLIQPQNLAKNDIDPVKGFFRGVGDLDRAREIVKSGDADLLEMLYGNVPNTLSQLIRTAFIAPPGSRFLVADFSAIEARVIAWLAGEKWRLDVFNSHGKIYEASAAQMFRVDISEVTKGSEYRAKGKIAELALGYQGGVDALIKMGALKMGLKEAELQNLVDLCRIANPKIKKYWYDVNDHAISAIEYPGLTRQLRHVEFQMRKGALFIKLPSGRELCYMRARLRPGKFGNDQIVYEGMDQTTKKWRTIDTYGGKLVENIVQAVARDLLAHALLEVHKAGYKIALHVHDEIIIEAPYGTGSTEEVDRIMSTGPTWSKGLPLTADSYETEYYYKKD